MEKISHEIEPQYRNPGYGPDYHDWTSTHTSALHTRCYCSFRNYIMRNNFNQKFKGLTAKKQVTIILLFTTKSISLCKYYNSYKSK